MENISRRDFIKRAGIVTVGLAAVSLPFSGGISETVPPNNQISFRITDQPMMSIMITAHPKKNV